MKHEKLCEAALEAVTKVFSDNSVGRSTTRESLKNLRDEIDILLDTLR